MKQLRFPDLRFIAPKPTREELFWAKVDMDGPIPEHDTELGKCWTWTGCLNKHGYAMFQFDGSNKGAYRYAYRLFGGELIPGLTIDHLCRNPSCVNPDHLEQVTGEENKRRAKGFPRKEYKKRDPVDSELRKWKKGFCRKGHKYTPENTRWTFRCIVCITCFGPEPP